MNGRDKVVVFIEGTSGAGGGNVERAVLAKRGYELVLPPRCATDDDVVRAIDGARAALNSTYRWGGGLFGRLPELKVVVQGGVGYDNIDVAAATRAGVVVCNTIGYGTHEVANHAFAMLLALNRKLIPLGRAVRNGTQLPATEIMPHTGRLAGQTLGLISFGAIARAVAKRAAGFEMRVIAFDPYVEPSEAEALGVELVTLPEVLSQCDYLSIHTPLSDATHHLIGADELALMKPSSYLILTSRGGLVDEAALVEALRENRVAGAGIDVWENEPPDVNHPLLKLDNVVASMHMGWYSEVGETVRRQRQAESAADLLDGILPHSVVNTEVLEHVSLKPRSEG